MVTDFDTFYGCKYSDFEIEECYNDDDDSVEEKYVRLCDKGCNPYNCEECKYFESKFQWITIEKIVE